MMIARHALLTPTQSRSEEHWPYGASLRISRVFMMRYVFSHAFHREKDAVVFEAHEHVNVRSKCSRCHHERLSWPLSCHQFSKFRTCGMFGNGFAVLAGYGNPHIISRYGRNPG